MTCVKLTLPPRLRARWLLTTMRLSMSSLAGTARTDVAVGTSSELSMFVTTRALAPRIGDCWASPRGVDALGASGSRGLGGAAAGCGSWRAGAASFAWGAAVAGWAGAACAGGGGAGSGGRGLRPWGRARGRRPCVGALVAGAAVVEVVGGCRRGSPGGSVRMPGRRCRRGVPLPSARPPWPGVPRPWAASPGS